MGVAVCGLRPEAGRDHPLAEFYAQVDPHCSHRSTPDGQRRRWSEAYAAVVVLNFSEQLRPVMPN